VAASSRQTVLKTRKHSRARLLLWARCHSCYQTNSVYAPNGSQLMNTVMNSAMITTKEHLVVHVVGYWLSKKYNSRCICNKLIVTSACQTAETVQFLEACFQRLSSLDSGNNCHTQNAWLTLPANHWKSRIWPFILYMSGTPSIGCRTPPRLNYIDSVGAQAIYTVFQKNPCDYVFDDNLNSKRPIVIIFGTVIT